MFANTGVRMAHSLERIRIEEELSRPQSDDGLYPSGIGFNKIISLRKAIFPNFEKEELMSI
jgi:hypothetical protein